MASESFRGPLLFWDLRPGREGVQFERFFRALSYLLHQWYSFEGKRRTTEDEDNRELRAIAFDKLALFLHRAWTEMFHRTYKDPQVTVPKQTAQAAEMVTFPSPMQEIPGMHGRGTGRFNGTGPPKFLLEILHQLEAEKVMHYFVISPPKDKPHSPSDPRTTVRSDIVISPKTFLAADFLPYEVEVMSEIGNALKHLTASEVRALGTHENEGKTVDDVHKEFRDARSIRVQLITKLEQGGDIFDLSSDMLTYAEEAWLKSKGNERDYEQAREKLLAEVQSPILKDALSEVQSLPSLIWGTDRVKELAEKSENFLFLSRYLFAIGRYQRHGTSIAVSGSGDANYFEHLWQKALKEAGRARFPNFPSTIDRVLDCATGSIYPKVRDALIDALKSIEH